MPSVLDNIRGKPSGFGVPVASTILHYIFPDRFPIIDIRTAEALYINSKIKSPDRSDYRIYDQFRSAIIEIVRKTGCSLHQIDRALFAYHRDVLQHKLNEIFKTWITASKLGAELSLSVPCRVKRLLVRRRMESYPE